MAGDSDLVAGDSDLVASDSVLVAGDSFIMVGEASNNSASKRKVQGRMAREKNKEQKRDETRLSLCVGRRSRVCWMVFSATASPRILQTQTLLWSLPLAFLAPVR